MAASVNETTGLEPAGLGPRLAALVIDWVLCLLIGSLYASPNEEPWAAVLILVAANTFFIGLFAQTPGMRLLRIRCASYPDGGVLGLGRGLIRGLLLGLFIPAMLLNSQGRGLHDRVANSIVVSVPRRQDGPGRRV
ncbi:RDD family protein [Actinoplanes sp. NBC_00393]|uniref:RDD family protein n=1 Tax=Actinoplanes sp. NBC_00393 TaxID=2975953 RepID=UPI002E244CAC